MIILSIKNLSESKVRGMNGSEIWKDIQANPKSTGHDHQFNLLKKDSTGKVIDRQYRGDEVAKDWMDWLKGE
jgi:hypothetical protein